MIPARAENITKRNVFLNAHFRIEPCAACPIPGYLIVTPKVRVPSLAQLSPDAQRALGVSLAAATHAIELVVRPQRVYCAFFAEETASVHFHLFPRTNWLLSSYMRAHPKDTDISGPRLLDWARSTFSGPAARDYEQTTQAIFSALHKII
jgi:diadenosine tetraphosphate (Ap4A) HIT family hydrolase